MARVTLGHNPELVDGDRRLRITPMERLILLVAMGRPLVTRDALVEILWPNPDNQPDHWGGSINVRVMSLRRKLEKFGWTLLAWKGRGMWLEKIDDAS
jgi:DNA-binding response OmpR family regulator